MGTYDHYLGLLAGLGCGLRRSLALPQTVGKVDKKVQFSNSDRAVIGTEYLLAATVQGPPTAIEEAHWLPQQHRIACGRLLQYRVDMLLYESLGYPRHPSIPCH